MPFCEKCGRQLNEGAKFCPSCGTPIASTPAEERKQVYEGELHKCPNCGEVLNSFVAKCPSCGYEIRENKASSSAKEFLRKWELVRLTEQKVDLIRNFPVPNNREDILEFMILASSNIADAPEPELFKAWAAKIEQCYQKAKVMFSDSNDLQTIQRIYDESQKKIKRNSVAQGARSAKKAIVRSGSTVSSIVKLILSNLGSIAGIVLLFWAVKMNLRYENSSVVELIAIVLLVASAAILVKRNAHLVEYPISLAGGLLALYLSRYLDNGAMFELGGGAVLIVTAVNFFRHFSQTGVKRDAGMQKKNASTNLSSTSPFSSSTAEAPVSTMTTVPLSVLSYSEKNYEEVAALFEHAGFTNVRSIPLYDLKRGVFHRSESEDYNKVESIKINGIPLTVFKRKYEPNAAVIISYHSFQA